MSSANTKPPVCKTTDSADETSAEAKEKKTMNNLKIISLNIFSLLLHIDELRILAADKSLIS